VIRVGVELDSTPTRKISYFVVRPFQGRLCRGKPLGLHNMISKASAEGGSPALCGRKALPYIFKL